MSKASVLPETVLYEDEFTTVTNENIKLEWYYFPTGSTKVIAIKDIEEIEYEKVGMLNSKAWGMPLANRWFGCDLQRNSREWICVFHVKDQWTNPACTPLRIGQFRAALDVARKTKSAEEKCDQKMELHTKNLNKLHTNK